jgi:hypothetical protein
MRWLGAGIVRLFMAVRNRSIGFNAYTKICRTSTALTSGIVCVWSIVHGTVNPLIRQNVVVTVTMALVREQ